MGIPVEWTSDLTGPEKENFIAYLTNSGGVLRKLAKIIARKDNAVVRNQISPDSFKDPNWALKQAYDCGRTSALADVLRLIVFSPDKEDKV